MNIEFEETYPTWKIVLDQKVIVDPNPLHIQFQFTIVQIKISQCPSNREFPIFSKLTQLISVGKILRPLGAFKQNRACYLIALAYSKST